MEQNNKRGQWSSGLGFVLAAAGSAIGLGNIWKFPYIAGVHGGGAFVLMYLFCIVVIGFSLIVAEFLIGRSTQLNPIGAIEKLQGKKDGWSIIGWLGVITAFMILTFYSVVSGWVINYIRMSITGTFSFDSALTMKQNVDTMQGYFGALLGDGVLQTILHFVFIFISVVVVIGGIKKGIERATNILMPLLFLMLIGLFVYSFFMPGSGDAWGFLFNFKFENLTAVGVLEALGHAFFTLSLASGAMITYASYLKREQSLVKTGLQVVVLDTLIALISGIIIFSIVFTFNLEPGAGPGLLFATLPPLFAQIPGGMIISTVFFVLVLLAALTSAISLLEVIVAYFVDTFKIGRKKIVIIVGAIIFLVGILHALSFNKLSEVIFPMKWLFGSDVGFFDLFDKFASNIFMPLGGLLTAIYVGWVMSKKVYDEEFKESEHTIKVITKIILKFIAPIIIMIVFLNGLGIIKLKGPEVSKSKVVLDISNVEDADAVYYLVVGEKDMLENGSYNDIKGKYLKHSYLGIKKVDSTIDLTINTGTYDIAIIKMANYGNPILESGNTMSVQNADNVEMNNGDTITVTINGNDAVVNVQKP